MVGCHNYGLFGWVPVKIRPERDHNLDDASSRFIRPFAQCCPGNPPPGVQLIPIPLKNLNSQGIRCLGSCRIFLFRCQTPLKEPATSLKESLQTPSYKPLKRTLRKPGRVDQAEGLRRRGVALGDDAASHEGGLKVLREAL